MYNQYQIKAYTVINSDNVLPFAQCLFKDEYTARAFNQASKLKGEVAEIDPTDYTLLFSFPKPLMLAVGSPIYFEAEATKQILQRQFPDVTIQIMKFDETPLFKEAFSIEKMGVSYA